MVPINELNLESRHFRYDVFIITIIEGSTMYDVWATVDEYGIMQHLFGIEKKSIHDYDYLLNMVRGYVDDNSYNICESIIGCN
jgi:hypothetical protein